MGIPTGIRANIFVPTAIKLLGDAFELTHPEDYERGPEFEFKLTPFAQEKFKFMIKGRAKILGILARVAIDVNTTTGVEIKFDLDVQAFSMIKIQNAFSLVLSPEKPFSLKNELEVQLNLRIPSFEIFGLEFPQVNLFSVAA